MLFQTLRQLLNGHSVHTGAPSVGLDSCPCRLQFSHSQTSSINCSPMAGLSVPRFAMTSPPSSSCRTCSAHKKKGQVRRPALNVLEEWLSEEGLKIDGGGFRQRGFRLFVLRNVLHDLVHVTFRTGVLEVVAGEATPQIELGGEGMRAGFPQRQRVVAARQFVMTIAAVGGSVACGAGRPVKARILAVEIVFPAGSMVRRQHHRVAGIALKLGCY